MESKGQISIDLKTRTFEVECEPGLKRKSRVEAFAKRKLNEVVKDLKGIEGVNVTGLNLERRILDSGKWKGHALGRPYYKGKFELYYKTIK